MLVPIPAPTTVTNRTDQKVYHDISVAGKPCVVKRNLSPAEFVASPFTHKLIVMSDLANRMRNEKAAIDFVREHTSIPVPNILFYMDEGDRVYLGLEDVGGVRMDRVEDHSDKAKIIKQLDAFTAELATHRSPEIKSFTPAPCFPFALTRYRYKASPTSFAKCLIEGYPLCHGDLHEANVMVDPQTMQVKAVLDWEHCGYYPPEIDAARYKSGSNTVVHPDGSTTDYLDFGDKASETLDKLKV